MLGITFAMKLRTYIASGLLLTLGGAIAYTFSQRNHSSSFFARVLKCKEQPEAVPAEGGAAPQPEPDAPAVAEPQSAAESAVPELMEESVPKDESVAPQPDSTPDAVAEPVSVAADETAPAPGPQPAPAQEPAPEPQPSAPAPSALPEPKVPYGKPGEGHEPEKYAEDFALFCEKLDEQVKNNLYDFCPAIQVVLAATNDEFAVLGWMQAAADKGNAAAMHFLADAELAYVPAGELLSPRVKKACELIRKSADMGYDPSKCSLSECLNNGIGVKKDVAKGKKVLMEACKGGGFIPRLRWLLLNDRMKSFADCVRPEVKAEIDRGNHHVTYFMSRLAPDSVTQLEWLRKAAEQGNPDAFHDLAVVNFKTHPKESYDLLKIASGMHNREALYLLGSLLLDTPGNESLLRTLGLQPDERMALRLIKTSAAMRAPRAVYFMGRCYYEGRHGMPQDKALAYRHFSQALALRAPDSGAAMGLMLLRGEGVEQDVKRGLRMITLAANSGYAYAITLMAYAHYNGLGTEANAARASEFLQEAAALGMPEAYVYLAFITAKGGAGREPNPRMAESYMRMATLDLKQRARELYDKLEAEGKWEPLP